jgi:RimJ/RimL family protein N-acetyltransferase
VRLEPLGPEHEDALWQASRDERAWRWLSTVQPATPDEWHAWMADAYALPDSIPYATVVRGRPLGSTRLLNIREHDRVAEIGWTWLNAEAWNTGANAEAKYLQLRHAFESLELLRVEFKTDALNERSRRALEALGATFEGIFRKHMLVRRGERRDSAWYSVIDEDWPRVKEHLEARIERHAAG